MKGVTPVLAALLMVVIVVGISGTLVYTLLNAQERGEAGTEREIAGVTGRTPFAIESVQPGGVVVRSLSEKTIDDATLSFYVNEKQVNVTTGDIPPNSIATLRLSNGILPAGRYTLKLTGTGAEDVIHADVPAVNVLRESSFDSELNVPLSVAMVLDRSGSMDGQKIIDSKSAAVAFVDMTTSHDKLAVVSFSDNATTEQVLTDDKSDVKAAIAGITAGGYTGIGNGINQGRLELAAETDQDAKKIMILLTDGRENQNSDPLRRASEAATDDITIYVIGLASDPSDIDGPQLQAIADLTGGRYFYAPSSSQLRSIFTLIGNELGGRWKRLGSVAIDAFGSACYSPDVCSRFTSGITPSTLLYQDVDMIFSGTFNVVLASAFVRPSGPICPNQCPQLAAETCADEDARIRLIALDSNGTALGNSTSPWASNFGLATWVNLQKIWTTPPGTQMLRFQIEPGDCCASCSATNLSVDDVILKMSNI